MSLLIRAGIERGKQIYRDRAHPQPEEIVAIPGLIVGYMWQAGFEHGYDGHALKFDEPAYKQGHASGLQARRRYRD